MHTPCLLPVFLLLMLLLSARGASALSVAAVLRAAPESASCAGATLFPSECATAAKAAPLLTRAFARYNISNPAEQRALVALTAFETGGFRYERNHWPGRPGQGTRNMQMINFNLAYARSIPSLAPAVRRIAGNRTADALSSSQANATLSLLLRNQDHSWGSAAWFLATQCKPQVRRELRKGTAAGFATLLRGCVGVDPVQERMAVWRAVGGKLS
ncbi:hypothetical protein DFJ74DRAFT_617383 [Hyaloraphidium curvatum]|nr:hypothetical protein DFJ74DRAFT_617383 [Hyaloraphidium curvatum]